MYERNIMPQNNGFWMILASCALASLTAPPLMAEPEGGLMTKEDSSYAEAEWHKRFAVKLNNRVWELLSKPDRTEQENEEMVHASHASHFHWSKVGKPVNLQRGEWLISHVYAVLNRAESALYHAQKCLALTDEHNSLTLIWPMPTKRWQEPMRRQAMHLMQRSTLISHKPRRKK